MVDPAADEGRAQAGEADGERKAQGDLGTAPAEVVLKRFDEEADGPEGNTVDDAHGDEGCGEDPPAVEDAAPAGEDTHGFVQEPPGRHRGCLRPGHVGYMRIPW
ncbi:MAG: hypothetical protein U5Q44_16355 [Dehalococcoidia bacterium]|nr:hypothetical protein [Dehalococcoidia bacterium]